MTSGSKHYKHIELQYSQESKRAGEPCGDVVVCDRSWNYTIIVISDGLGHGIKANIAATMACSRILELIKRGFSIRDAFKNVVQTMHDARMKDLPYAVFTIIQVLNDGSTTILNYEMPSPIIITNRYASLLKQRNYTLGGEVVAEANCFLDEGNSIVVTSDGVTQAGMGITYKLGWTSEGFCGFLNNCIRTNVKYSDIRIKTLQEVNFAGGNRFGDDTTVAFINCRNGNILNIFTGPPLEMSDDDTVVSNFLKSDGIKVVCGSSTANIVSRYLDKPLKVDSVQVNFIEPPKYSLEGIDLVTEGAVTLNQVYNILDEKPGEYAQNRGGVSTLYSLFQFADRINFTVGKTKNEAHTDVIFRQMGVLPRTSIVPLIAEKLKKEGKLVVINYV
ncbi:MAG: SpoIIE family protein phosphatase [Candidatus Wallbacteria bacterium]